MLGSVGYVTRIEKKKESKTRRGEGEIVSPGKP